MMDVNDVHKFWQERVRRMEEEGNEMCRDLRAEVARLQSRCQELAFEGTMMRASCAYDFKAICESKADSRGQVALTDIYEVVQQYGGGLVEVPDKHQGLGALGPGSSREARKRDRNTMQMELDVAIRDPANLGHLTLDPDTVDEHRRSQRNSGGGGGNEQRRPAMNSVAAKEQAFDRLRHQQRQEDHELKQQQMMKAQQTLKKAFEHSPQPHLHQQVDVDYRSAPGSSGHSPPAAAPVAGGGQHYQQQQQQQPHDQQQQQQQQQLLAGASPPQQQQGHNGLAPLLDENATLFPGNDVNRKRPRWAEQHFGQQQGNNNGGHNNNQQQQQGGQFTGDDDEEDDMPEIEREILNERPTRPLRFNHQDPY